MVKYIIGFIVIYAVILLSAYLLQRSLIYLPSSDKPVPKEWEMSDVQEIMLTTADGLHLLSWYKPPQKDRPTIMYFQGNAGHIGLRGKIVRPYLDKGYGILLLGYRGYGGNPGSPSEQGLYLDALAGRDFLRKQVNVNCIVLFGESLGSGVAIELAHRHPAGALILLAPFTSMSELGSYHYPFLPVNFLLKDRYDSVTKMSTIKIPLLVLLAENDLVIPTRLSKRLYDVANPPKEITVYNNVGHNDLHTLVPTRVMEFIEKHSICKKGAKLISH